MNNYIANSKVLVTGGAGYIGSHTCLELLNAGYQVVVLDNFSNSKAESLQRVQQLARRSLTLVHGDVRERKALADVFSSHKITSVIHFAGLKAVGESVEMPLVYYDNNVGGSIALVEMMKIHGVNTLVFSSSATVYGDPITMPIREDFPLDATNPYGRSKLMVEQVYRDLANSDPVWKIALLRYFNPVGAHESGSIGEDPNGVPNNLMPYVAQVAVGKRSELSVFGGDYPTHDGTGVRDYIHVVDLALGHISALRALEGECSGVMTVNLGTGQGYSVLQVVQAFEVASGRSVPYKVVGRRLGDVATCYADPTLAAELLGWRALRGIDQMCRDVWRWQSQNPNGYA